MERQLRMGGGIMSLSKEGIGGGDYRGIDMGSRAGFGVIKKITRGAKKAVKGATRAVKKIASSDVGKAALLYGATAGLGSIGSGQTGLARFAPSNFMGNLGRIGSFITGGAIGSNPVDEVALTGKQNIFQKALGAIGLGGGGDKGSGFLTKGLALAGLSTFLTDQFGMSPEQAEETIANPESRALYLRRYYQNLNPNAQPEEVEEFVAANVAEYSTGGRVGFANGPVLPPDTTQPVNPFGPKPGDFGIEEDIPIKMASNLENDKILEALFEKYLDMGLSPKDAAKAAQEEFDRMSKRKMEDTRGLAALGGRMGFDEGTPGRGVSGLMNQFMSDDDGIVVVIEFDENNMPVLKPMSKSELKEEMAGEGDVVTRNNKAKGDSASINAMQAASAEGLPLRQNPKGVKELDLRDSGGFIPPVGIKEKADDIPAMLSNNEFVFTADAVRGMGDGDVNLGAQRMYDQMKMLEAGGKV